MKRVLTLKLLLIIMVVILMMVIPGCGGVQQVNTNIHIPEMDTSPDNDSYYVEGWKKLKEGNPREAIKNFERSSTRDESLFVGFGYAFLVQNRLEFARRNFERALGINPDNLQAQFGLATRHELLNEKKKAFQVYSKLRTLYPENAWVKVRYDSIKSSETENYLKQAELYKKENREDAYINALEAAARYSPEMIDINMEIADFFNSKQQYPQAVHQYEKVLEKLPHNQEILMKLAEVYEKMNRFDSALIIYRKMQELRPGDLHISNKINELKIKFHESNLPPKFKNIYFKRDINREELAALLGFYFEKYLETQPPVIITDIGTSFAKEYIIKVCTLGIMNLRPDHSFDRFSRINRAALAVVINALLKYLEKNMLGAYDMQFHPLEEVIEPVDISPLHKDYETIKFLVNSGIMKLDEQNRFNPTADVSPSEVLETIKKILTSIQE
ncbi:MAG: tetratricopeptide repeat protein [Candidatus Aminicenantes bacterium]|jgi:tetratricopeptide (TPR) repeat protein